MNIDTFTSPAVATQKVESARSHINEALGTAVGAFAHSFKRDFDAKLAAGDATRDGFRYFVDVKASVAIADSVITRARAVLREGPDKTSPDDAILRKARRSIEESLTNLGYTVRDVGMDVNAKGSGALELRMRVAWDAP